MASRSDVTYTTVNTDLGQCETGLSDQEYAEDKSFPYLQIPWKERVPQIAVHLAFFCVYSLVSLVILIHGLPGPARSCPPQPEQYSAKGEAHTVYSPANEVAFYGVVRQDVNGDPYGTRFAGNPRPELDDAWSGLLDATNLRISANELSKMNRTSLPLADGSGDYWGSLEVFHHLHCLKIIRHYIAIDYYPAERETTHVPPGRVYPEHIEHCVEALRLYLICQPDLSVWTYEWRPGMDKPYSDHTVEHECVDWEKVEQWAHEKSFSIHDPLIAKPGGGFWPQR